VTSSLKIWCSNQGKMAFSEDRKGLLLQIADMFNRQPFVERMFLHKLQQRGFFYKKKIYWHECDHKNLVAH